MKVLSTVLGGGMAGRLFVELRDRRALAYTAAAYYEPVHQTGALVLYLGIAPDNATRAETARDTGLQDSSSVTPTDFPGAASNVRR